MKTILLVSALALLPFASMAASANNQSGLNNVQLSNGQQPATPCLNVGTDENGDAVDCNNANLADDNNAGADVLSFPVAEPDGTPTDDSSPD
ncbi:MAG TPA: hypothetical protein VH000_09560 [Rhizomicrobium sp.]|jgi:hypothetical protein|nr:hypothetical protein [Rhizomicrobium sp.]